MKRKYSEKVQMRSRSEKKFYLRKIKDLRRGYKRREGIRYSKSDILKKGIELQHKYYNQDADVRKVINSYETANYKQLYERNKNPRWYIRVYFESKEEMEKYDNMVCEIVLCRVLGIIP